MKISYRVSLDDPKEVRRRRFVRDAGPWPFPSLPSAGDAIAVDDASTGRWILESGEGETALHSLTPLQIFNAARVQTVVYVPATADAFIDLAADGLRGDFEEQITALVAAGFREIN